MIPRSNFVNNRCFIFFIKNGTGLLGGTESYALKVNTLIFTKSTTISVYTNVVNCECVLLAVFFNYCPFVGIHVFAKTEQHIQKDANGWTKLSPWLNLGVYWNCEQTANRTNCEQISTHIHFMKTVMFYLKRGTINCRNRFSCCFITKRKHPMWHEVDMLLQKSHSTSL